MSDQPPEESDELAQVLSRINALMKQGSTSTAVPAFDENIPLLTEIYEGPPLTFAARQSQPFSTPDHTTDEQTADHGVPAELIESLLEEMMPLIQATVKETVQLEMVKVERVLATRLEIELLQTLRQRLQSN